MSKVTNLSADHKVEFIQRETLCLPDFDRDEALHTGELGFPEALQQYFVSPENNAAEKLIILKRKLGAASTYDFWNIVLEGLCEITGSQCGFISKRILVDDQNTAIEMPPLGEPGSCLMGIGFYLVPPDASQGTTHHDYKYQAYGTPCAWMKHEKVFIIPERMTEFIPNNPNDLLFKSEAYIGVPLFSEGKCFAHFGMIWSDKGAKKRTLGWGFIEMLLHSLEDMILQRISEGRGFAKEPASETQAKYIPLDAITACQSLKPYARSLSHELRTPMQGVVGMLDIMYSTITGSIATQSYQHVSAVLQDLKENIEQAQDSSKRAVEAADAVVNAYDLNLQMPETALPSRDAAVAADLTQEDNHGSRPGIVIEGAGIPLSAEFKRKRPEKHDFHGGPPLKKLAHRNERTLCQLYDENQNEEHTESTPRLPNKLESESNRMKDTTVSPARTPLEEYSLKNKMLEFTPTQRHINTREFLRKALSQPLENEHPEMEIHTPSERGETVEIRTRGPRGEAMDKTITLIVDEEVPDTIVAEEAVLRIVLHKVIDNAIKFTDAGNITIDVNLAQKSSVLEIRITDQGCGITTEAQANLFKPFSQQDSSLSRQKEGLGMGLYIAKARTRQNLGGEVTLEKSETDGPNKGSQFLIRLPMSINDSYFPPLIGTPNRNKHQAATPHRMITKDRLSSPNLRLKPRPNGENPGVRSAPSTPLRRSPNPPSRPVTAARSQTTNPRSSRSRTPTYNPHLSKVHPITFLIAEDNALNRKLLVKCLESLGYPKEEILIAIDGAEAVELYKSSLESGRRKVDMILMDLWMPNLDGYQATERILEISKKSNNVDGRDYFGDTKGEDKGEGGNWKPAIMAVTADITSEAQEKASEVGMKGFMSKPYKVIDVQNLIEEHFRREIHG